MYQTNLYSKEGKVLNQIQLPESIFSQKVSEPAVYDSIKAYLANQRLGTACTKTRGEVSGGGKKPWKQKGTGRARVRSTRNPIWRGGGVVFGPKPHSFKIKLPKKVNRRALISALIDKAMNDKIVIIDSLALDKPKTSVMAKILKNLNLQNPLIILDESDTNLYLSVRNIEGADVILASNLNPYKVLLHEKLLFTKAALDKLETRI
ncbi:MAG: 50S ribosomal protein L4 [bacterium]|nr:50S ribosomal protein L4 [bacterium]